MKLTAILLTIFVLKSCGTSNQMANANINDASKTMQTMEYSIEYSAMTRGSYKMITIKDNTLSYQNSRTEEPTTRPCTNEEIKALIEQIDALDLTKLPSILPPTKKFEFDGALMARLTVSQNENDYKVPIFDHGNPNEYIAPFVHTILSMVEKH